MMEYVAWVYASNLQYTQGRYASSALQSLRCKLPSRAGIDLTLAGEVICFYSVEMLQSKMSSRPMGQHEARWIIIGVWELSLHYFQSLE